MPITPYHFGPGVALKAFVPKGFSLSAYVLAQFIIDLEPLYFLIRGEYPWHRFMHTLSGATLVAALAILFTQPCRKVIGSIRLRLGNLSGKLPTVSWFAIVFGAIIGAYSHIVLDAMMHDDVLPLALLSMASPWHGIVSIEKLEVACLSSGLVGLVVICLRQFRWYQAPPG